jgi:uncharacterized protein (DUF2141 family)
LSGDAPLFFAVITEEIYVLLLSGIPRPPHSNDLVANQTNVDAIIGSVNYDIGHLVGTGGGGIAGLGVVCSSTRKAQGLTGSPSPVGDAFDIDYVAHEMGHQFSGHHPFNGTGGSCAGGNRTASTAWEPGSGSTIMGYAGICGAFNDLQPHSDPTFHTGNYQEMRAFIDNTTCGTSSATGNTAPVVTAPASGKTLPISTPFKLTATATDAENDALTYMWEELDLGPAQSPTAAQIANSNVPLFRSFVPLTSGTRYFPRISDLVNNTTVFGERLPTVPRSLNFRCTARDQHSGPVGVVGGVDYSATVNMSVTSTAGPFVVTSLNTAVNLPAGAAQIVTWDVANTTAAPVSCATVNILLSLDGGLTYPTVLATGVPNNGRAVVVFPNTATSTARLQVEAADNYFFDISDTNFSLVVTPRPSLTSFSPGGGLPGTVVTIRGGNLSGATSVTFNGRAAASFVVNSNTQITATVAAGTNTGTITVTVPAGTATSAQRFFIGAPPVVASFTPITGPVGAIVVLTGSGFTAATAVTFGGVNAPGFTVDSDTQITVTVPAGALTGPIAVTTPIGTGTSAASFVVLPTPIITSFTPTAGPPGIAVVITGSVFTGVTLVNFNGVNAPDFTVNSDTQITVTVPAGATTGLITMTTPNGQTTSAQTFTVNDIYLFNNNSPATTCSGTLYDSGGSGANYGSNQNFTKTFTPATAGAKLRLVFISQQFYILAGDVLYIYDGANTSAPLIGQYTGTTSPGTVTATNAAGQLTLRFTSDGNGTANGFGATISCVLPPAPAITSFTPTNGPVGTTVTLTGTNLGYASSVSFNGTAQTTFISNSATEIVLLVPAGATSGLLTVTTAGGTSAASSQSFTVLPSPPSITSFTPASGPLSSTLTLTGQNLLGLTSVLVGEVPAQFSVVSSTSATLVVPRQATSQKIRVTSANGTGLSATVFAVTRPSASGQFVGGTALTTNGNTLVDIGDFSAPAVTDVDGDGRLDLLVGDLYGNVRRFEQVGTNSNLFAPVAADNRLTTDGTTFLNAGFYAILAVTDLDGNGRLDLLAGNADGNVLRYEQTARYGDRFAGGAALTTAGGTALNVGTYSDLAVTDLDGNGLLDLLVSNNVGNIQRYEQAAANSSSFASIAPLTDAGNTPLALGNIGLTVTDLDSDGLLDMLVGLNSGRVARYEQTAPAANSFTPLGNLTTNGTTAIATGNYAKPAVTDVDGDGLLDLLVGSQPGTVLRFEQDVPGVITGITPATGVAGTAGIVITGTNLSGASAVTVNGAAATITGNTATTVTFTVPAGTSNNQGITVTTGGGTSLAYTGFAVRLLVTGTSPAANARAVPTANSALALTFTEPVTAASIAPSRTAGINVYSTQVGGRKAGSFSTSGSTVRYTSSLPGSRANFKPGETVSVSVPATVLGAGGLAARKRVYQFTTATGGTGRGNFPSGTSPGVGGSPLAIATGDVDGDGDLDLVTSNSGSGGTSTASVRLNGGDATGSNTGTFSNGSDLALGPDPRSMTLGDVDGDGDLDLVTANYNGNTVSVRLNGGDATGSNTGTFSNGSDANIGSYIACLAVGDVDGDGDLDLVTTHYYGTQLRVLLNGGDATGSNTGTFSNGSTGTVGGYVYTVTLGDVDGDGDLDVLTANPFAASVSVRLNGGDASGSNTGTFSNGADVPVNGGPYTVVLGDVDADGDLDFVSSNQDNRAVTVRLNGGDATGSNTGTFSNGSTVTVAGNQRGLALGDVDGDGDLDLLTPILSDVNSTVSVRLNQAPAPLPVELLAFTATPASAATVRLTWATASEKNSARFEVERSLNGMTFITIGTVTAAGSSSTALTYGLLDDKLPAGVALLYYRLKQVDLDGTSSHSPVRSVSLTAAAAGLALFPNPAHGGAATLSGAVAGAAVTVYDALGRLVMTATADAAGTATLALPAGLPAGVYVVRASSKALRLTVE